MFGALALCAMAGAPEKVGMLTGLVEPELTVEQVDLALCAQWGLRP